MAAPNFTDYANNIKDIARTNRFTTEFTGPFSLNAPKNLMFHVKSATIPKIDVLGPEIKYRGTKMNLRGDVKKDPLTITFYSDTDWTMRRFFEDWVKELVNYSLVTNLRSSMEKTRFNNSVRINQYPGTMEKPIVGYTFLDIAPFEISETTVDQSTQDSLMEFSVVFHYSRWWSGDASFPISALTGLGLTT